ncbi:hypothetical protein SAMN05192574_11962 [Mucilaginibacter gossypiicola]|uniref:Uncharacterized protein n=1 Tax=Mucilaginibacter gossypiicola TaxID=551995 RepID=A0A1H8UIE3_9SPHI|nr:hypothetical protein SAMN05192574_11962 [Mucilaginibacter gossypiicola]
MPQSTKGVTFFNSKGISSKMLQYHEQRDLLSIE